MPHHAALYSQEFSELPLEEISTLGRGSRFSAKRSSGRVTSCEFRWSDLRVEINVMPGVQLKKHLQGFAVYVASLASAQGVEIPEGLAERILETRMVLGIVVEPALDPEERAEALVTTVQLLTRALLFRADAVYDEQGNLLIGAEDEPAQPPVGAGKGPEEAEARKERSIARLKSENVPVLASLPLLETAAESLRRTSEEAALRALALCVVALKGEGLEQAQVERLVKELDLPAALSPREKAFLRNPKASRHDRVQFSWRYECVWVLLWALGFIEELSRPDQVCDAERVVSLVRGLGRDGLLKKAGLRPQAELLDAADLIYRYHWAVVDARVNGRDAPAGLDPGVVQERHYALNWLIGYGRQAWDDVSTDT